MLPKIQSNFRGLLIFLNIVSRSTINIFLDIFLNYGNSTRNWSDSAFNFIISRLMA